MCLDIRRIGPTFPDPQPRVLFGELFDDEQVEQYYEALVGTLKSAKKRKSDICIFLSSLVNQFSNFNQISVFYKRQNKGGLISFKGQMLLKGAHDNVIISLVGEDMEKDETTSDSTPTHTPSINTKQNSIPDDDDLSVKSLPIFKTQYSSNSTNLNKNRVSQYNYMNKSSSSLSSRSYTSSWSNNSSLKRANTYSYRKPTPESLAMPNAKPTSSSFSSVSKPSRPLARSTTCPSAFSRTELSDRIEKEIPQLLKDIRRIGCPGEPSVKFGELFDDEEVEQYYEALVGTLKCAKKRGYITFKGQMLLKGMHDKVQIDIQKEYQ